MSDVQSDEEIEQDYKRYYSGRNIDGGWSAPTCWTCRWWTRNHGRVLGDHDAQCRRNAPSPKLMGTGGSDDSPIDYLILAEWPVTLANDWCGEHKPLPSKRAPKERTASE